MHQDQAHTVRKIAQGSDIVKLMMLFLIKLLTNSLLIFHIQTKVNMVNKIIVRYNILNFI